MTATVARPTARDGGPVRDAADPRVRPGLYVEFRRAYKAGSGETVHARVLAAADDYAMLRRPGCFPFVAHLSAYVGPSTRERASDFSRG